jgi:ribonucleotide reductase beta subunit family protein with ferritin-like domain
MNFISIEGKTSFFERRVAEYQKAKFDDKTFSVDAEF